MRRFDRTLPWALVAMLGSLLLLGVAWDASFEATPANSDLVSQGDDRIRELKQEIADRGEDELCWGTGATSGCPSSGDNGFAREGSARAFFANANPATLNDAASTALGTGHDGRIYIDDDGADNVDGNNDDNQFKIWTGVAWQVPRLEAVGGLSITALANGDILKYDGTNFVDQALATLVTFDRATFAIDEAFTNDACGACTVASVPDHAGGSDTNNYAEVTVPAAPSGVTWDIHVSGQVVITHDSGDGTNIGCELEEDVNDADTFNTTRTVGIVPVINNSTSVCRFGAVRRGVTAGNLHAFRVKLDGFGGTEDYTVEDAAALPAAFEATSEILVEVRPRTVF
jgi:hypothetical protein